MRGKCPSIQRKRSELPVAILRIFFGLNIKSTCALTSSPLPWVVASCSRNRLLCRLAFTPPA
jgi:hypothetical protein